MEKKYLGFTSMVASEHSISIGSKLGTVYIYNLNNFKDPAENNNLVTHISQMKANRTGELSIALSKWKSNAIRVLDSISGKTVG